MTDNWLNKLMGAVVLFVAIIIVGFLTLHPPVLNYELTGQQTLAVSKTSWQDKPKPLHVEGFSYFYRSVRLLCGPMLVFTAEKRREDAEKRRELLKLIIRSD